MNYNKNFWDNIFYKNNENYIEHKHTIYHNCPDKNAFFHYQTTSNLIYLILIKYKINLEEKNILDIGSGSGYWIDLYNNLFNNINIIGIDISKKIIDILNKKYDKDINIEIINNDILNFDLKKKFFLINAIGVMFHIVDDNEFENSIKNISKIILNNGYLIIGGEFGNENKYLNFIDENRKPIKKIRSLQFWEKILNKYKLKIIKKYLNNCRNFIHSPQNNILFIQKQE